MADLTNMKAMRAEYASKKKEGLPAHTIKLANAHSKEMRNKKAEVHNFGFGQGDTWLHSITDKGGLISRINKKTGKIKHTWDE